MKTAVNSIKVELFAFLVFILITTVYLHPIFLGKVDTPIDIRDINMYPWRYYSVDKKVKKIVLWNYEQPSNKEFTHARINLETINLLVPPNSIQEYIYKLHFSEILLSGLDKIQDVNYYLSFEFQPTYVESQEFNFGLFFINKRTGNYYSPGISLLPAESYTESRQGKWYKAYFPLNELISNLKSVQDLSNYDVKLVLKNKSKVNQASLYLNDFKIVGEDFTNVAGIHNAYINDLIQWFTPAREFYSESLKAKRLPFWSNYTLTGSEFIAEPQVGFFHPLFFLSYYLFDHFTAHSVVTFVSFLLCGIGAFLLARFWKLGFSASLLTGIVYMFHPFNVTWFSFEHMLMNSATLPFLLLSYEKNIKCHKVFNSYLIISAFLLGLIFISGHLQIVYYTIIFFALFVLFRFIQSVVIFRESFLKHGLRILFIFLFGIMISAIVTVPFFYLFQHSHRVANPDDFIKSTSIPLKAFLGLLYPFYNGYPYDPISGIENKSPEYLTYKSGFFRNYVYFGLLPLIISFFSLRKIFQNPLTAFFFFSIIFSILIVTGSPLFFMIKNIIPGFKQLQHYRFLEIYSYCVPFICGIGFQVLLDWLSFFTTRFKVFLITTVILITLIDLMYYSSYFITWSDKASYKPVPKAGALEFLIKKQNQLREPFRVLPFSVSKVGETKLKINAAQPNTLQTYGLEEASGYSSLISKDLYNLFVYVQTKDPTKLYLREVIQLFSNTNIPYPIYNFKSKILDLLNVKYFLVPNILTLESDTTKKVYTGDSSVYENLDCLPRVFVVPDYELIRSSKETISRLGSNWFNPRNKVILMSFPEEFKNALNKINQKSIPLNYKVKFNTYEHNKTILNVSVNRPSILVFGNNLNDNWKVKINGVENKHYQANLVQRAIYLPQKGNYTIEFYYFPFLFFIGGGVSLVAVLVLLVLFVYLKYIQKEELKTVQKELYNELGKKIKINV